MPVDLSKMGLEGIESYHSQMESMARTNSMNVNAQAQQAEIEANARMQQLNDLASQAIRDGASRRNLGTSEDPEAAAAHTRSLADPIETVADVFLQNGAVETAADLLGKASEIRKRESDIDNDKITAQQNRLENILKGADIAGRYLGTAKNESEWRRGLEVVRESGTIEPEFMDQLEALPFNENLPAYFADQAMSAAESARLEIQTLNLDARERDLAARNSRGERQIRLQEQRLAETQRLRRLAEKNSGKVTAAGAPSKVAVEGVTTTLKATVFADMEDVDDTTIDATAQYVTSKAQQIVKENKAISWDVAVQQAITQAKAAGVLQTFDVNRDFGLFSVKTGKKVKVDLEGKAPETAVQPPITGAGKVDPTKLKRGTYYKLPNGEVGKWNGKGFVVE